MYIFETAPKEELNITLEKLSLWYEYNNYQIIAGLIQNCKNRYEYPFTITSFFSLKNVTVNKLVNIIEDRKLISLISKIFNVLMPITLKDFNLYKNFLLSKINKRKPLCHSIWIPPISKDKFYIDEIPNIMKDLSFAVKWFLT